MAEQLAKVYSLDAYRTRKQQTPEPRKIGERVLYLIKNEEEDERP